jgi:hypothetical protein
MKVYFGFRSFKPTKEWAGETDQRAHDPAQKAASEKRTRCDPEAQRFPLQQSDTRTSNTRDDQSKAWREAWMIGAHRSHELTQQLAKTLT